MGGGGRNLYVVDIKNQLISILTLCVRGDLTGGIIGPLWSLIYEVQLYVIFGLLIFAISSQKYIYKLLAAVLMVLYLSKATHNQISSIQLIAYLCFLCGAMVFFLRTRLSNESLLFLGALFSIASVSFLYAYHGKNASLDLDTSRALIMAQILIGAILSILVALVARIKHFERYKGVGGYAYTLYIFHFPLMLFMYFVIYHANPAVLQYSWFMAIAGFFIVIVVCRFVSFFVEKPKQQREYFRALSKAIL